MITSLRVRVHLNLANPEKSENVVKVRRASGSWSTVAYATELLLENCVPVVDLFAQERVRSGTSRKVHHAYIEGDLVHFHGRIRKLAPQSAVEIARPYLRALESFVDKSDSFVKNGSKINYNPRFAKCFYKDAPSRDVISEKFLSSAQVMVIGWSFFSMGSKYSPMLASEFCKTSDLALASVSEKAVLREGRASTRNFMKDLATKKSARGCLTS